MFRESIDDSANINELLQSVADKIYQKGFEQGRPKFTHDLPLSDSACWNCEHCHDGGAISGWFCDIHGSLSKTNKLVYRCCAWTEKHDYQIDSSNET